MTHRGPTSGDQRRALLVAAAAIAVVGASVVVFVNALSTSSARVAASTSSDGLLGAASISLSQPGESAQLLLDGDGLYPGIEIDGCVVVEYAGSVPVVVRLHGAPNERTGLDPFIDFGLVVHPNGTCSENADSAAVAVFDGRLDRFWALHGAFGTGVELDYVMTDGDRIAIAATATVIDDNRAQGQTTDFTLNIEARPA